MYNFVNQINATDRFRRGFLGQFTISDEPTFLTFSIDFIYEGQPDTLFGMPDSPLLTNDTGQNSAMRYLESRKLVPEAARLKKLIEILQYTTKYEPWFFQSIKGLKDLWSASTNMKQNRKGSNITLNIETLESLDLKVTYLADLYRKAVYDSIYMRELIPDNLRYFKMIIYVAEFRNLRSLTEQLISNRLIQNDRIDNIGQRVVDVFRSAGSYFEDHASFMQFDCHFCEFDFSPSIPVGDNLTVYDGEMANNSFNINVGWFMEKHQYRYYDIMTKDGFDKHANQTYLANNQTSFDDLVALGSTLLGAINSIRR